MNKQEFIKFLKTEEENRKYRTHWKNVSANSDEYWNKEVPFVDGLQDSMDLRIDGIVKISYNQSLYDNKSTKIFETTYDDFVLNYEKTLR